MGPESRIQGDHSRVNFKRRKVERNSLKGVIEGSLVPLVPTPIWFLPRIAYNSGGYPVFAAI